LGEKALNGGCSTIKFRSERMRVPGAVKYDVLDDFEKVLNAKMLNPAKP
jgi:hypothetical protein